MKSINDDKKSNAFSQVDGQRSAVVEGFINDFRKNEMAAIANLDEGNQTSIVNWAQDIVDRYGTLLQDYEAKIKDIDDLPCSREDVKIAIKVLLPAYLAKGPADTVDLLKDRYVRLSAFQVIRPEDREIIKKTAIDDDQASKSSDQSLFPIYHQYMQIVISEQNVFLEEIKV